MIAAPVENFLLRAFEFFGTRAYAAPEIVFWEWFGAHEASLFALDSEGDPVFCALAEALEAVHVDLCFELGTVAADGSREFVISASGNLQAFPAVERLLRMAPELPRWRWVKFRPRRLPLHTIEFGGKSVHVDEVHYALVRDAQRAGVILFLEHYNSAEQGVFQQIGRLLLDEALGEHAAATRLGFVELQSRASRYFPHASPLCELSSAFDAFFPGVQC